MKFLITLSATFAAGIAFAAPRLSSEERFKQRLARRASGTHDITPTQPTANDVNGPDGGAADSSNNWAGFVIKSVPDGTQFTTVSATLQVPLLTNANNSNKYSGSMWVGIDGDTCQSAILQTGIDYTEQGESVSYNAWYEFYPDYAHDIRGISLSAGDIVNLTVVASSATSGTTYITNESTGQSASTSITSSSSLCQENAEWILEDYTKDDELVPFAYFTNVTFPEAEACTSGGNSYGPSAGEEIDIFQKGEQWTTAKVSGNSITISCYV